MDRVRGPPDCVAPTCSDVVSHARPLPRRRHRGNRGSAHFELPSAWSRRHRGGSRPFPRGRVVGSSPTPVVVAAGRVGCCSSTSGRATQSSSRRGRVPGCRCRPARGTGRPPAPADGAAPTRGARISHRHRDHVGGGPAVLRSLDVGAVIDPMQPGSAPDERGLRSAARAREVPLVPARLGATYRLGKLRIRVLWPHHAGSPEEDPHIHGTVLLASYGAIDPP